MILGRAVWENHIIIQHPEVTYFLEEIEKTVRDPNVVMESSIDPQSKLFHARGLLTGKYRDCYVRVVIRYEGDVGFIRTAYFPATLPARGKILWVSRIQNR